MPRQVVKEIEARFRASTAEYRQEIAAAGKITTDLKAQISQASDTLRRAASLSGKQAGQLSRELSQAGKTAERLGAASQTLVAKERELSRAVEEQKQRLADLKTEYQRLSEEPKRLSGIYDTIKEATKGLDLSTPLAQQREQASAEMDRLENDIRTLQGNIAGAGKGGPVPIGDSFIGMDEAKAKLQELIAASDQAGERFRRLDTAMQSIGEENLGYASKAGLKQLQTEISGTQSKLTGLEQQAGQTQSRLTSYAERLEDVHRQQKEVRSSAAGVSERITEIGEAAASAPGGGFGARLSGIGKALREGLAEKLKEVAAGFMKLGSGAHSSGGGMMSSLTTMLRYAVGIRSLYALVGRLRAALTAGMQGLAKHSDTTNRAISSMSSALKQMEGSIASAFAPLVNVAAPYVTAFVGHMAEAFNAVGAFFAALTGQSSYTKAVYNYQSVGGAADSAANATQKAAAAQKELNRQLMGFDQINKLNDNSSGSSDSGGSGGNSGGSGGDGLSFVTQAIPGLTSDWAKKFKDAWKDADFTEIGGIVAGKLRDALDNIPWDDIKKSAKKVAESIATFINGFFETPGLAKTIARTVTNAIDTAFTFINKFLEETHWDSIGKFLSEAIQEGIHTFPGEKIGTFISDTICSGLDFATGFVDAIEPDKLAEDIKNQLKKVVGAIKVQEIIDKTTKLIDKVLTKGSELVEEFFDGLADDITGWALDANGNVDWDKIKEAFKKSVKKAFDLAEPIAELAEKWPDIFPNAFKDVFRKVSLVSQIVKLFGPLEEEKTWETVGAAIETAIKKPFEAGVKGAEAVVGGLRDWIKDIKFEWDPLHGKFGLSLPDKPVEMYVLAKAKELALDNKDVGVTANANKLKDNISQQDKTLDGGTVKASSLEDKIPADKKTVGNVKATTNSISWGQNANKDLSARAKTSSINWAPSSQKDLSGVKAKTSSLNWAPSSQKDLSVHAKTGSVGYKKGADKDVSVSAKTSKIGWSKNASKGLTVSATAPKLNLKDNTVKVKLVATKDKYTNGTIAPRAMGGVFQHGIWSKIPQYAGGTPNAGSLFVAGEAGPEVVGHVGGRTEVLNKSQIASAIYSAVTAAVGQYKSYFSRMSAQMAAIAPALGRLGVTCQTVAAPSAPVSRAYASMQDTNWMDRLVDRLSRRTEGASGGSSQPIRVQVVLDGRVVAESTVRELRNQVRMGQRPLSELV